jgi:hypothetical protein
MLVHFTELTGVQLKETLAESFGRKAARVIGYAQQKLDQDPHVAAMSEQLTAVKAATGNDLAIIPATVQLITLLLKEEFAALFTVIDVSF